MNDDAMMRWLGDSVRRKGFVLPDDNGSTDERYEEDVVEGHYGMDIFLPTSVTSGQYLHGETEEAQTLLSNAIVLTAEQHGLLLGEALASVPPHGFYANANLRQVKWGIAMTGSGITSVGPIPWSTPLQDLSSLSITNWGDLAIVVGRPASLEDHIKFLLTGSKLKYAQALAERLIEISRDLQDHEEDPIELSGASVASLLTFLEAHQNLSRPKLAPTANGGLVARWQNEALSATVNIFFTQGKSVQYYLSTPNSQDPADRDWDSGATTIGSLPAKLERHGAWRWMMV